MPGIINFKEVSQEGLETSKYPAKLAGLRAHEARYFMNKYKHEYTTKNAEDAMEVLEYIENILKTERDIIINSKALEVSQFEVGGIKFSYVFYASGLAINVMYTCEEGGKRAVGFKLCEDMEIPSELAEKFKFARQRSALAGTIRGSFFVIKGEY